MNPNRITGSFLNYFEKLTVANTWVKETGKGIGELQITQEDIKEIIPLMHKLRNIKSKISQNKNPCHLDWGKQSKISSENEVGVGEKKEGKYQLKINAVMFSLLWLKLECTIYEKLIFYHFTNWIVLDEIKFYPMIHYFCNIFLGKTV